MIRKKPRVLTDPLTEAEATTNTVLSTFETLVADLQFARDAARDEHARAESTITSLRDRQRRAEEQAERAHRVSHKLAGLIS